MNDIEHRSNSSPRPSLWSKCLRWATVFVVAAATVWGGNAWRHASIARRLANECRKLEEAKQWPQLLIAAREWHRAEPARREPLNAGVAAGKALRQPATTASFLRAWPRSSQEDIPYLTMLAELQFDVFNSPAEAVVTWRDVIRIDPSNVEARRRLVFSAAVTRQISTLLKLVDEAALAESDLPEFFVYAFLADGLRMQNARDLLNKWQKAGRLDESLMVAFALHTHILMEGTVEATSEDQAASMRRSQNERKEYLAQLRKMHPNSHELLAHDLDQALKSGDSMEVASLLERAPLAADADHRFWRARAWLMMRAGDLDEADVSFKEAASLCPIDWRRMHYQADWLRRKGQLVEAEHTQKLAQRGRELESELLTLANVQAVSPELLTRMADFARDCGATQYETRLRHHASRVATIHPSKTLSRSL